MKFNLDAKLVLENGKEFYGNFITKPENIILGEVIFNTAINGYQEVISDPSYTNQIVVFSFPLVGSYGTNNYDNESLNSGACAIIVNEFEEFYSNSTSSNSLKQYLELNNIGGICNVNTRELTIYLRDNGCQKGIICDINLKFEQVKSLFNKNIMKNLVYDVSIKNPQVHQNSKNKFYKTIVLYDFGVKQNIINELVKRDIKVICVNCSTNYQQLQRYNPDAIFLSNGPGDPRYLDDIVINIKELLNLNIPIFGICLGLQLIGKAFNFDIEKLTFGHHSINHPVKYKNKIYITSQNHNYAICENNKISQKGFQITHKSLNDNSIEGLKNESKKIYAVQYHPESCPGPNDSNIFFDEIIAMLEEN